MRGYWLIWCAIMAVGCDSRVLDPSSDTGETARDGAAPDTQASGDRGGAGPTFCAGETRAERNGVALSLTALETGLSQNTSCCGPNDFLRFVAHGPTGEQYFFMVEISHFPDVPQVNHIDLANPPAKYFVTVNCEHFPGCGMLSTSEPDNVSFEGTIDFDPQPDGLATRVTMCLAVSMPQPYIVPYPTEEFQSLKLWTDQALVNQVCLPGSHPMCNDNPIISSLQGTCNDDSTCTCAADSKKNPATGKCM